MQVNTKLLKHAIESATLRLDNLIDRSTGGAYPDNMIAQIDDRIDVGHELGALYSLFLELAESVAELQKEHNG